MYKLKVILFKLLFSLMVVSMQQPPHLHAQRLTQVQTFATWNTFEVDKLAAIWLIQRFIDPKADIRIYPKGTPITQGTPFDTPDAEFRRYHNVSTYEMLRRRYNIDDPRCRYISRIVHDIEINTWEQKVMPESRAVIQSIRHIIDSSANSEETIEESRVYFDRLYQQISLQESVEK